MNEKFWKKLQGKFDDEILNDKPKTTLDFEIDGQGSTIEEINDVILKILSAHEGIRELHIRVKL